MVANGAKGGAGLRLNTHENARKSLARLLREFHKKPGDVTEFRAKVHAFSVLLQYFTFEKDLQIEQRLEQIEEQLCFISDTSNGLKR